MENTIIAEIDLGEILEIEAMREVGVGQMVGNLEVMTEGTTEVLATVDQGMVHCLVLTWQPLKIFCLCFMTFYSYLLQLYTVFIFILIYEHLLEFWKVSFTFILLYLSVV